MALLARNRGACALWAKKHCSLRNRVLIRTRPHGVQVCRVRHPLHEACRNAHPCSTDVTARAISATESHGVHPHQAATTGLTGKLANPRVGRRPAAASRHGIPHSTSTENKAALSNRRFRGTAAQDTGADSAHAHTLGSKRLRTKTCRHHPGCWRRLQVWSWRHPPQPAQAPPIAAKAQRSLGWKGQFAACSRS